MSESVHSAAYQFAVKYPELSSHGNSPDGWATWFDKNYGSDHDGQEYWGSGFSRYLNDIKQHGDFDKFKKPDYTFDQVKAGWKEHYHHRSFWDKTGTDAANIVKDTWNVVLKPVGLGIDHVGYSSTGTAAVGNAFVVGARGMADFMTGGTLELGVTALNKVGKIAGISGTVNSGGVVSRPQTAGPGPLNPTGTFSDLSFSPTPESPVKKAGMGGNMLFIVLGAIILIVISFSKNKPKN